MQRCLLFSRWLRYWQSVHRGDTVETVPRVFFTPSLRDVFDLASLQVISVQQSSHCVANTSSRLSSRRGRFGEFFSSSPLAEDCTYYLRRAVNARVDCLGSKVARAPRGSLGTSIFCELVPSRFAKLCLEYPLAFKLLLSLKIRLIFCM